MAKRTRTRDRNPVQTPKYSEPITSAGRPSKALELVERRGIVVSCIGEGLSIELAAAIAEVTVDTIYQWQRDDPEFRMMMINARAKVVRDLTRTAHTLATQANSEAVQAQMTKWLLGVYDPAYRAGDGSKGADTDPQKRILEGGDEEVVQYEYC